MEQASVSNISNIVRRVNMGLCATSSLCDTCMFYMERVAQATFTFRPPNGAGRKVVIRIIEDVPRVDPISNYQW